jgi:hypothetical protein
MRVSVALLFTLRNEGPVQQRKRVESVQNKLSESAKDTNAPITRTATNA